MACVPAARLETLRIAVLEAPLPSSVLVPSVVGPSKKVTIPIEPFDPVRTVAVKLTDWPQIEGLREDVTITAATGGATDELRFSRTIARIRTHAAKTAAPIIAERC